MENAKFSEWCIIEVLGRVRLAGYVTEQQSGISQENILRNPRMRTFAIKEARIQVHPDKGGSPTAAAQVDEAARILEAT